MVIGIGFRTAPVAVRERFFIGEARRRQTLAYLAKAEGVEEAMVVSTCERTEFVLSANDAALAANSILRLLSSEYSLQLCEWEHFYRLLDEDALVHLFRLAAGAVSIITGDAQVAAHLQQAWDEARTAGTSGRCLDSVWQTALAVSERIRGELKPAESGPSIAWAAMETATAVLGSLERRTVVLIGAGKVAEACGVCLSERAVSLRILNRTFEHALQLARRVGGTAVPFEDLAHELAKADVVFSATRSAQPVLSRDQLAQMGLPRHKPGLCIVDLGMPRNVDPGVRDFPGVLLHDLDDVSKVVSQTASERNTLSRALETINAEAKQFLRKLAGEHTTPMISAIREHLRELCRQELQILRQECGPFTKDQDEMLAQFGSRVTQRLTTSLMRELREAPEKLDQEYMSSAVHRLSHPTHDKELVSSREQA